MRRMSTGPPACRPPLAKIGASMAPGSTLRIFASCSLGISPAPVLPCSRLVSRSSCLLFWRTDVVATRPGEDSGGTGARVLASVAARGHKTGWLGYDRAYTQALPGRFHLPARALGYSPVMDYRADQLGIQANTGGAILVEGTWHCPALPGPLITATTRLRDHAITRDLYDQQITARRPYQLKRKDGPDADGYQRLSCPALGKHPGLICPLRQASLAPRDGRAKVLQPPARTTEDLLPDSDHHRPRHRCPLPPGPALRQSCLAPVLRHLAQHHRRPQRLRQRPRPRSPGPARPPPRPRHRRPVH